MKFGVKNRSVVKATVRLLGSIAVGFGLFLLPLPSGETSTVLLDIIVTGLRGNFPSVTGLYCFGLIFWGGIATLVSLRGERLREYNCSLPLAAVRVIGVLIALMMLFEMGPEWLINDKVSGVIWGGSGLFRRHYCAHRCCFSQHIYYLRFFGICRNHSQGLSCVHSFAFPADRPSTTSLLGWEAIPSDST